VLESCSPGYNYSQHSGLANFKSTPPPPPPKLVSLVAHVAEDGLIGHQWEKRPWAFLRLYAPEQGNAKARKQEWVGCRAEQGEGMGDFQKGNQERG
jgi:hypothetical protein